MYEVGQAMFSNEILYMQVVDSWERVEHGSIFPNFMFREEGGREIVEWLGRSASAAQTDLLGIMSTETASLEMI